MKKVLLLVSTLSLFSLPLQARPQVESFQGNVKIHEQGKEMVVHASDRAIIHYKSFDVQADEAVWFQMQEASHRILNRIESTRPSHIDGRIISNGIVYLLNPAGVAFGPHSIVDVNGLIVAAAHLSDDDFIHHRDYFTSIGGNVEVLGHLSAKEVILVGIQVFPNGKIDAKTAVYSVGRHCWVGKEGEHLFVKCEKESLPGEETAPFLGCGTAEGYLIHHGGMTKADALHIDGGKGLVHLAGTIDLSHRDEERVGGSIVVQGERIETRKAHIDVTGKLGGGTVFIGGGENGQGIYPTALEVDSDTLTTIAADALVSGDGGKIVLYGDKCKANGLYSVMGGIQGGNAGTIETSGSRFQSLTTKTRMFAPSGKSGVWKIDPHSIQIIDMGGMDLATFDDGTNNSYVVNSSVINNVPAGSTVIFAANNSSGYEPGSCSIAVGTPETPAHINPAHPNVKLIFNTTEENSGVSGTMQINGSVSSDTLLFQTPVAITGPTNISASSALAFNHDVTGEGSSNLHITAQKELSAQGSMTNLGNLQIKTPENQGEFTITTPTTLQATGDISIGADLKLSGPATFASKNITFHSPVTANGNDIVVKADGKVQFDEPINTTGAIPVIPGDGHPGGNVTLTGDTIHLAGVYAGGTAAFPGASGIGGKGGDVQITTQSGLHLKGPIYATGGAGVNGGGQVLPTLVFSGQSLDASGADSPGNITISGPVFLNNQATLRGQHIQASDFTGNSHAVLAIDGATSGKAHLGNLSHLGHFVVNDSKGVEICGDVHVHDISLLNSGSEGIVFKGEVTADQINTMANRFVVTFEKSYTAQVVNLRHCANCGEKNAGASSSSPKLQFAGVSAPSQGYLGDISFDTSTSLFSTLRLLTSGPFADVFNLCTFSLNYLSPPQVVDKLTREQLAGK